MSSTRSIWLSLRALLSFAPVWLFACAGTDGGPATSRLDGGNPTADSGEPGTDAGHDASQPAPVGSPLWGLVDMTGCPPMTVYDQVHGVIGGCVKFIDWASLEPAAGSYDFSIIDSELAKVDTLNAKYPADAIGLKIRVLAGASSPAWALDLGGPHMTFRLCGPNGTIPSCAEHAQDPVPRFWTREYGDAYNKMMRALSEHTAGRSGLRDIVVTRCTTIFGEPMVRTYGQASNAKTLLDAGYTQEKDLACQRESIDLMKELFPGKYVSESFSTYEIPRTTTDGVYGTEDSEAVPVDLMKYFRAALSERAIAGNNELGRPPGPNDNAATYAYQKTMGAPLYYQLDSLDRLKADQTTKWKVYGPAVQRGAEQGAAYIEIRGPDYRTDVAGFLATMKPIVPQLRKNAGL